ncbi:electron transfer flavoprotein subunit alpha/FixB family protein, partial [Aquimarina celericrescens]|nr:electron transfer flavoprotein subunit alpha/FixB family protein [Aquimarina celericrescens]
SYAKEVAAMLGTTVTAISVNAVDDSELATYGVDKVLAVKNDKLSAFNAKAYADIIKQAAEQEEAKVIVVSSSADSKFLSPLLAVTLNAGYVSNVVALPENISPFTVKRT